jgi:hypothetical protein
VVPVDIAIAKLRAALDAREIPISPFSPAPTLGMSRASTPR